MKALAVPGLWPVHPEPAQSPMPDRQEGEREAEALLCPALGGPFRMCSILFKTGTPGPRFTCLQTELRENPGLTQQGRDGSQGCLRSGCSLFLCVGWGLCPVHLSQPPVNIFWPSLPSCSIPKSLSLSGSLSYSLSVLGSLSPAPGAPALLPLISQESLLEVAKYHEGGGGPLWPLSSWDLFGPWLRLLFPP